MQKREDERNILFIYELGHIDAYGRFLDENPTVREEGHLLIALGPELEYALAKKRIQFSSGRECVSFDAGRFLSCFSLRFSTIPLISCTTRLYLRICWCGIQPCIS